MDDVEVNPILIQKGMTKLALYGMGSMRDERLNRMWQQKKVRACPGGGARRRVAVLCFVAGCSV